MSAESTNKSQNICQLNRWTSPFSILESKHQIDSIFGIIGLRVLGNTTHRSSPNEVSIWDRFNHKNTDFGSITPNIFIICSQWLESF